MSNLIDLGSSRARQARLGKNFNAFEYKIVVAAVTILTIAAVLLWLSGHHSLALLLASPTIFIYTLSSWWKQQLSVVPPSGKDLTGSLSVDILSRLQPATPQQPQAVWHAISRHWQANFLLNHMQVPPDFVAAQLSNDPNDLNQALQIANQLAQQNESPVIELGFLAAGLIMTSPALNKELVKLKLQSTDVESIVNWLGRSLATIRAVKKRHYGGIGRDWAFGFTPLLNRFGYNVSMDISASNASFGSLTESNGVAAMEAAFNNHSSSLALIGPDGIGKTNSVYALAQRLIEGTTVPSLAYHQIVSINATDIVSNASRPGELEQLMLSLAREASHAGHIILFFDDAQLFFNSGPGAFDASQILLSIIQGSGVPMIFAMSPNDYQRLKSANASLANRLTPVVLQELPEAEVMKALEDYCIKIESHRQVIISYEALRTAYRLSGRYEQDEAYPGKAIKLLEQSVTHSQNSVVTAASVEQAIEQAYGVKVGEAAPAEADELLNLEAKIHERMINQSYAVGVVANALRRARAGVANPRRPIGSFMFLGPTGVGKTELAKAIAATYFGAETNMIRLDMSEYQQPEDVNRLLSNGKDESKSLIMAVREQPFSVVLLDEIEKAHPNILNLLLQLLDEGQLTDTGGRAVSFKDSVIITTSNAGAQTIRQKVQAGEAIENLQSQLTDELINSGQFKPELLNRFDEVVLFRPLTPDELVQVVGLMVNEINQTLSTQNIYIELTAAATQKVVEAGYDPRLGARPMRRILQKAVENVVAQKILAGEANPGDHISLDANDLSLETPNDAGSENSQPAASTAAADPNDDQAINQPPQAG